MLQLCRPLSGAVSSQSPGRQLLPPKGFNCAAPFRGRLVVVSPHQPVGMAALQLCRPLSGAVSNACRHSLPAIVAASIVPPPFGGG